MVLRLRCLCAIQTDIKQTSRYYQLDIINLKLRDKDKAKEIKIGVISIASHQHSHQHQRALLKINKIQSFTM